MFNLVGQRVDADDAWVGKQTILATVENGQAVGKMRETVNRLLNIGSYRIGLAGQSVKMSDDKPWLVAYALNMSVGDLRESGFSGLRVRAFTPAGNEIPMPRSYVANMIDDVIMQDVDQLAQPVELSVTGELLKAGRNAIVEALTALDAISATGGKIPTPWPIGEPPTVDPKEWETSEIETVPIAGLTATQRTLNVERVREYVQNPGKIDENRRAFANVYANSDGLMIVDGHHRLAALWLLGADNANVWVLGE
jgi:hypothetical protein